MKKQIAYLALAAWLLAGPLHAAPETYVLEPDLSEVAFRTTFGTDEITGKMPVSKADLTLDFDHLANCKFVIALDAAKSQASFPFAAQAMKGPKVLNTAIYPMIKFESISVEPAGKGASVTGMLTIRGIRKPIVLDAQIYRQQGTRDGDRSHLSIHLTGTVQRGQFGATGWAGTVGDEVRLDILARIARVN